MQWYTVYKNWKSCQNDTFPYFNFFLVWEMCTPKINYFEKIDNANGDLIMFYTSTIGSIKVVCVIMLLFHWLIFKYLYMCSWTGILSLNCDVFWVKLKEVCDPLIWKMCYVFLKLRTTRPQPLNRSDDVTETANFHSEIGKSLNLLLLENDLFLNVTIDFYV